MRLRQRALGALALLGLVGILTGLPMLLLALGNPLPSEVPTWNQLRVALLSPDDGTLALGVLKALGWVLWAALVFSVLTEVLAQLRGRPAPTLPGLVLPQATVRGLVSAALAVFVLAPSTTHAPPADAAPVAVTASLTPGAAATLAQTTQDTAREHGARVTHAGRRCRAGPRRPGPVGQVHRAAGGHPWSIAQQHLGSGDLYPQIVSQPGHPHWGPGLVRPGHHTADPHRAGHGRYRRRQGQRSRGQEVEVKEGDTLSGLAEQHLKDPEQWPQIYQASKNIHQPNGSHLTDPDLIYPGWHLHIPETSSQHTVTDVTEDDTVSPEPGGSAPVGKETARRVTDLGSHLGPAATERSPAGGTPATLDTSRPAAQAQPGGSAPPARDAGEGVASWSPAALTDTAGYPDWMLAGLVGSSGAILGGGMFLALANRRRAQFRNRRPGHTITTPVPGLAPVEGTRDQRGCQRRPRPGEP